jgi:rRNA maturation protein Rpf1
LLKWVSQALENLFVEPRAAQEMRLVFPNAHKMNRGNYVMKEIADYCRANQYSDLVILHEHRGVPDALVLSHFPHGPTCLFTLHNVALRHDTPNLANSTVSEQYPHLIFDGFASTLGARVQAMLKYLFPVPRPDSKRVMTFANEADFVSFRHHVYVKTGHKEVQIAEVGPRFEMRRASAAGPRSRLTRRCSVRDQAGDHRAGGRRRRMGALHVASSARADRYAGPAALHALGTEEEPSLRGTLETWRNEMPSPCLMPDTSTTLLFQVPVVRDCSFLLAMC